MHSIYLLNWLLVESVGRVTSHLDLVLHEVVLRRGIRVLHDLI